MIAAVLVVGSPGAGKTSVLEELATLHDIEGLEHGALEAEQLSLGLPRLPAETWVPQLEAILSLQRQAGRRLFLISATVGTADEVAAVRAATGADELLVVCLTASAQTVARRIDAREPDHWPGKAPLIERARSLARSVPLLPGVDLVIDTERTRAAEVAAAILRVMRDRGIGTASR